MNDMPSPMAYLTEVKEKKNLLEYFAQCSKLQNKLSNAI